MTLEISQENERLVRRFMTSGGYHSPEELLVSLLRRMEDEDMLRDQRNQERDDSWSKFDRDIDLDKLAEEQGVGPLPAGGDLTFSRWPKDDSVDAFLSRAMGRDDASQNVTQP